MRKVVIASDSFKGSLTSAGVAGAAAEAVREVFPDCEVVCLDVADGGEGTLDALCRAAGAERIPLAVRGPLGGEVPAEYAVTRLPAGAGCAPVSGAGGVAVLESSRACGLTLVPEGLRNPLLTGTFGVGQMMADALRRGCRDFIVGLGGSATNDAGIGMLAALGWRFLDREGRGLPPVGASLGAIAAIDDSSVDPALLAVCRGGTDIRFTAACDVDTPFCGPDGAAAVFAPQKGADAAAVAELDAGMASFAAVIEQYTGVDVRRIPGAGAAGGLGGALRAFLGADLKPGADLVLDAVGFDALVAGPGLQADLVITGEGRLDAQTARGKLPHCVLRRASRLGVPTLALAGQLGPGVSSSDGSIAPPAPAAPRFSAVLCVTPPGVPLDVAMQPVVARRHVREAVRRFLLADRFKV